MKHQIKHWKNGWSHLINSLIKNRMNRMNSRYDLNVNGYQYYIHVVHGNNNGVMAESSDIRNVIERALQRLKYPIMKQQNKEGILYYINSGISSEQDTLNKLRELILIEDMADEIDAICISQYGGLFPDSNNNRATLRITRP